MIQITVEYNEEIQNQILSHLDGWAVSTVTEETETVEPFIDDIADFQEKNCNKRVSSSEVRNFFYISFDKALLYCNRLDINNFSTAEKDFFLRGVCLLAASDLWNKYNIRVNNEDMEDTYVQSYGGLLYKQAMNILNSFINQRVNGLHSIKEKKENNNNIWII